MVPKNLTTTYLKVGVDPICYFGSILYIKFNDIFPKLDNALYA